MHGGSANMLVVVGAYAKWDCFCGTRLGSLRRARHADVYTETGIWKKDAPEPPADPATLASTQSKVNVNIDLEILRKAAIGKSTASSSASGQTEEKYPRAPWKKPRSKK